MTSDRATLEALRERVRKAEGPDRELDCLLWAEFDDRDVRWDDRKLLARHRRPPHDECWLGTIDPGKHQRNFMETSGFEPPIPRYSASIDAAVALVKRLRPGDYYLELSRPRRYLNISTPVPNYWRADVDTVGVGWGATAPLAILSAVLFTLIYEAHHD